MSKPLVPRLPSADAFGRVLLELQCHCDIQANKGPQALQHKAKSATPEPAAPMASIRGGAAATSRPLKATSRENRRSGAHREAEAAELARVLASSRSATRKITQQVRDSRFEGRQATTPQRCIDLLGGCLPHSVFQGNERAGTSHDSPSLKQHGI